MRYILKFVSCAAPRLRRLAIDQRGAMAVLTAISATAVIGVVGLAVDVGYWQMQQRQIQGAAEQAAYAASFYAGRLSGTSDGGRTQAKAVAAALGLADTGNCANGTYPAPDPTTSRPTVVCVNSPPQSGSSNGVSGAVEVIIKQLQPTFLSKVVLSTPPIETGRAVAKAQTQNTGTMALANADCKGGLPLPSDCDVAAAISVSGGTNISFNGASIISNASSTSAISVQTGSLAVGLNAYASGTDNVGNNGTMTVSGTNSTNSPPIPDPYAGRTPPTTGSCPANNNNATTTGGSANSYSPAAGATIQPGTYCGGIVFGNSFTMAPGVYVLKAFGNGSNQAGDFNSNGSSATVTATGVTIYLTGDGTHYGSVLIGSGNTLNITAPTTASNGQNQGIAIWVDKNAPTTSSSTFSSGSTTNLQGALYAPSQTVNWSGNSGNTATCTQIIARVLNFTGGATFGHTCAGAGISEAIVNASISE